MRLETEEAIIQWREQRRAGSVKVELDHEQVDLAKLALGIRGQE